MVVFKEYGSWICNYLYRIIYHFICLGILRYHYDWNFMFVWIISSDYCIILLVSISSWRDCDSLLDCWKFTKMESTCVGNNRNNSTWIFCILLCLDLIGIME